MGNAQPAGHFRITHLFQLDLLHVTVYEGTTKLFDLKKKLVVFEKGTKHCQNGDNEGAAFRLSVYHKNTSIRSVRAGQTKPDYELLFTNKSFCGLINSVDYDDKESSFSPTISVVTLKYSVVLSMKHRNYEQSSTVHQTWYKALQNQLQYEGYWQVEQLQHHSIIPDDHSCPENSQPVTLCIGQHGLSVLIRADEENSYTVKTVVQKSAITRWDVSVSEAVRGEIGRKALVKVTANNEELCFRIENNANVASDIESVLNKLWPRANLADVEVATAPDYDIEVDASDVANFDLNQVVCQGGVMEAVHFYENSPGFHRPVRPPDVTKVVISNEQEVEYWSVVNTLEAVLKRHRPRPDTLRLSGKLRLKLCFHLLDKSIPSWIDLAELIGLTQDAVRMIEVLWQQTLSGDGHCTPPEYVLRHWQFVHNRWAINPYRFERPLRPCTAFELSHMLGDMGRQDLVQLINIELPTT